MKQQKDYEQDIAHIRSIMERSSRFLSLSGRAGVFAGLFASIGVYIAHNVIGFRFDERVQDVGSVVLNDPVIRLTAITAILVMVFSITTAVFFFRRQAIRNGEEKWDVAAKRLVIALTVPLMAGGVFSFALLSKGQLEWISPVMLLFYGMALFNARAYTIDGVKILAYYQITLGLICSFFPSWGLWFWLAGFGLGHIVYGTYIYVRYER